LRFALAQTPPGAKRYKLFKNRELQTLLENRPRKELFERRGKYHMNRVSVKEYWLKPFALLGSIPLLVGYAGGPGGLPPRMVENGVFGGHRKFFSVFYPTRASHSKKR
jgi:hypothetical protein